MTRRHIFFTHRPSKPATGSFWLHLWLACFLAAPAHGEPGSKPPAVDSEAIRYEAIELVNRLHQLEQKLLYPVHTRVSVFVSAAENSRARPHSVSLEIDGSKVTDHIYTQQEINALGSGGIQRLYTGNVLMGNHKLRVLFRQTRKDGSVQTSELDYTFNKDEQAENIEIIVDHRKPPVTIQSRN